MFSREESKKVREEFWTSFGREYPRKWILYNTRIKEVQLKFTFTNDVAQVSLDVTSGDEIMRAYYWEKIESLKNILLSEYLPDAIFEEVYLLPEGKLVSRVYTELKNVNIHRQKDWPLVMQYLEDRMSSLELFFLEYSDYISA